jgi:16S rRNA (uracil1498-N3)-methyltransferase
MFYSKEILPSGFLEEQESFHAIKVLRLSVGDHLIIGDGKGRKVKAVVNQANFKKCGYDVVEDLGTTPLTEPYIHLLIAPTKSSDRIEWMLEKCTEIGFSELTLIDTKHSERRKYNMERLEKIVISAMKQSGRMYIPKLNGMISLKEAINQNNNCEKFIAYVAQKSDSKILIEATQKTGKYQILIGPEGDFTDDEVIWANNHGYANVSLGNYVLRTETAGLVAVNMLNNIR